MWFREICTLYFSKEYGAKKIKAPIDGTVQF